MRQTSQQGLTLLEVLVAMMILAVALTAIIKATTENIRATAYLQEKTLATWIGLNAFNRARLELLQLPQAPEYYSAEEVMFGQGWEWQASRKPSKNPRIQEVRVKVLHLPDRQPLSELQGYFYAS